VLFGVSNTGISFNHIHSRLSEISSVPALPVSVSCIIPIQTLNVGAPSGLLP